MFSPARSFGSWLHAVTAVPALGGFLRTTTPTWGSGQPDLSARLVASPAPAERNRGRPPQSKSNPVSTAWSQILICSGTENRAYGLTVLLRRDLPPMKRSSGLHQAVSAVQTGSRPLNLPSKITWRTYGPIDPAPTNGLAIL